MKPGGGLFYHLYAIPWIILDWIYPPRCGGCDSQGSRWCIQCQNVTPRISTCICERCGRIQQTEGLCQRCKEREPEFRALRSWGVYQGPLKSAIQRLKYRRNIALGEILSRYLIDLFYEVSWTVDVVSPVPLGIERLRERGYNQAALLAKPLALRCGIKYIPKILSRVKETSSQVDLTYNERWKNVAGAFKADDFLAQGIKCLLVDDVATSGATLNACALALLEAGATEVYALTLARAG